MYLNDYKKGFGKKVDQHACLGEGEIGLGDFRLIMND
jgi:deoxyribonuclease-4